MPRIASVEVMFVVSVVVPQNQIDIAGKPQAFRRGLEACVILRLGGEWTVQAFKHFFVQQSHVVGSHAGVAGEALLSETLLDNGEVSWVAVLHDEGEVLCCTMCCTVEKPFQVSKDMLQHEDTLSQAVLYNGKVVLEFAYFTIAANGNEVIRNFHQIRRSRCSR